MDSDVQQPNSDVLVEALATSLANYGVSVAPFSALGVPREERPRVAEEFIDKVAAAARALIETERTAQEYARLLS